MASHIECALTDTTASGLFTFFKQYLQGLLLPVLARNLSGVGEAVKVSPLMLP